jgi:hypothetical protein
MEGNESNLVQLNMGNRRIPGYQNMIHNENTTTRRRPNRKYNGVNSAEEARGKVVRHIGRAAEQARERKQRLYIDGPHSVSGLCKRLTSLDRFNKLTMISKGPANGEVSLSGDTKEVELE